MKDKNIDFGSLEFREQYLNEYHIWRSMLSRCNNPNTPNFDRYGGRGISVCERWSQSFPNFLADMGPRPGNEYSVERENNDQGYSPSNCCWATAKDQNRNRSNVRFFVHNGETLTMTELASRNGLSAQALKYRLDNGMTLEDALKPVRNLFEFQGESLSLREWAAKLQINYATLYRRICIEQWPIEKALTQPVKILTNRKQRNLTSI